MDYTTILSALAEPSRLQIVELLRKGPLTVGKQQTIFIIRQPQASYNEAGMVGFDAETNRRIYKLRSKPFKALDLWLKEYRDIQEEKLDNLDRYQEDMQKKVNKENEN